MGYKQSTAGGRDQLGLARDQTGESPGQDSQPLLKDVVDVSGWPLSGMTRWSQKNEWSERPGESALLGARGSQI